MQPEISLLICTHNPRREYLDKVLQALQSQTLPIEFWELLFIDNASDKILASEINLDWHSQASHLREDKLGKNYALLTGFQKAKAELLIIVDDDNVLDQNYLEIALQISKEYPFIGAWGGQIRAIFETPPPEWTKPYWGYLAIREFQKNIWSNFDYQNDTTPPGAGMCVRKCVTEKYTELVCNNSVRKGMGRKGTQLNSYEDSDLAFTACDIGLGTGQFTALSVSHLIPCERLEEDYLLRLREGISYSGTLIDYFRGRISSQPSWKTSKFYYLYIRLKLGARGYRFYMAAQRGFLRAVKEIANFSDQY